jgi:hypothetical protein
LRTTRYKDKHFLATSTMCKAKDLVKDDLGKQAFMLTKNRYYVVNAQRFSKKIRALFLYESL